MIHEEIVTCEVAKLAKEKGFDVPTAKNYRHENGTTCNAPTQSLLQRWLREEKKIVVEVGYYGVEQKYYWRIYDTTKYDVFSSIPPARSMSIYDTWEQALESGLKYALNELK